MCRGGGHSQGADKHTSSLGAGERIIRTELERLHVCVAARHAIQQGRQKTQDSGQA